MYCNDSIYLFLGFLYNIYFKYSYAVPILFHYLTYLLLSCFLVSVGCFQTVSYCTCSSASRCLCATLACMSSGPWSQRWCRSMCGAAATRVSARISTTGVCWVTWRGWHPDRTWLWRCSNRSRPTAPEALHRRGTGHWTLVWIQWHWNW